MDDLEICDVMHLNAAEGWLELGHALEADKELDQITPAMQRHPEVLARRCEMLALSECWFHCEKIAEEIIALEPESTFGWIRRSTALHKQDLTGTARLRLLPAVDLFPNEIIIHYNLASYECALGNLSQAKLPVFEAFNLAHSQNCVEKWKKQMLEDAELKPLWGIWDEVEIPG